MRLAAALLAIAAACAQREPSDREPPPSPPPSRPIDRPPAPTQQPPPSSSVRWRVPILAITKDAIELAWRPPQGADEVALHTPLASWDCAPLRDALAAEVAKTWPNTVRPSRSKQLLISADAAAPYAVVLKVMDCAQGATGARELYPDVMLTTQ
jgi:hypothetical protein